MHAKTLPHLFRIRLELARTGDFPDGSSEIGYEFRAPLTRDGHIDVEQWKAGKSQCTVRHFHRGADDEHGYVIRVRNHGWAFSYAPGEDDDEPFIRLEEHTFREGEYVSITTHDGALLPFKVVSVKPLDRTSSKESSRPL